MSLSVGRREEEAQVFLVVFPEFAHSDGVTAAAAALYRSYCQLSVPSIVDAAVHKFSS